MVRLVFRPYTQIRRSICTSEPLRASTRVSSGFALFRHSSPSFGSQRQCSYSDPFGKAKVGPASGAPRRGAPASVHFHCAYGLDTQTLAQTLDSLVRVSRRVAWNHFASVLGTRPQTSAPFRPSDARGYNSPPRGSHVPQSLSLAHGADADPALDESAPPGRPIRRGSGDRRGPQADAKRFPFNNFTHFFTLFSKYFSSFNHSTCSLSVSRRYLALDEVYHPL